MRLKSFNSIFKVALVLSINLSACTTNTTLITSQPSVNPVPNVNSSTDNSTNTKTDSINPNSVSSGSNPSSSAIPSTMPSNQMVTVNNGQTLIINSDFLKFSHIDYSSTDLKWTSVNGARSYKIYQDGKLIADNITDLGYSVRNLTPNTDYIFEILAINEVGESNRSSLKVRTFIISDSPSNNSSDNTSSNNSSGTTINPTPATTGTVIFEGGYSR